VSAAESTLAAPLAGAWYIIDSSESGGPLIAAEYERSLRTLEGCLGVRILAPRRHRRTYRVLALFADLPEGVPLPYGCVRAYLDPDTRGTFR